MVEMLTGGFSLQNPAALRIIDPLARAGAGGAALGGSFRGKARRMAEEIEKKMRLKSALGIEGKLALQEMADRGALARTQMAQTGATERTEMAQAGETGRARERIGAGERRTAAEIESAERRKTMEVAGRERVAKIRTTPTDLDKATLAYRKEQAATLKAERERGGKGRKVVVIPPRYKGTKDEGVPGGPYQYDPKAGTFTPLKPGAAPTVTGTAKAGEAPAPAALGPGRTPPPGSVVARGLAPGPQGLTQKGAAPAGIAEDMRLHRGGYASEEAYLQDMNAQFNAFARQYGREEAKRLMKTAYPNFDFRE